MLKKLIYLVVVLYVFATSVFTVFTIYLASPTSPIGAYKTLLKVIFVNPCMKGWNEDEYQVQVEEAFENFNNAVANKVY